jgi:hypothetical protein
MFLMSFFKVWWRDATLFVYFIFCTYIHSVTFIQYTHPSPFVEFLVRFSISISRVIWIKTKYRRKKNNAFLILDER